MDLKRFERLVVHLGLALHLQSHFQWNHRNCSHPNNKIHSGIIHQDHLLLLVQEDSMLEFEHVSILVHLAVNDDKLSGFTFLLGFTLGLLFVSAARTSSSESTEVFDSAA